MQGNIHRKSQYLIIPPWKPQNSQTWFQLNESMYFQITHTDLHKIAR
jgi:hypothetical protein